MTKRVLFSFAVLTVFATSAHAVGCDFTVIACPGNAGASQDAGTLDCAGGATLTILGTFQPAEAIADFAAADCIVDICLDNAGDLHGVDAFWDFQTANAGALNGTARRPATGCVGYADPFSPLGSGFALASAVLSTEMLRIAVISYRPSGLSVLANSKLFAFALTIDASTSLEAGGTAPGCTSQASMTLEQVIPGSLSGVPTTTLTTGSLAMNYIFINGAPFVVAAKRHSWGSLKSLFR